MVLGEAVQERPGFRPHVLVSHHDLARVPELGQGGAVCIACAEPAAGPVSSEALGHLSALALAELGAAGEIVVQDDRVRAESRALLYGFAEYHLERRIRSVSMLVRTAT